MLRTYCKRTPWLDLALRDASLDAILKWRRSIQRGQHIWRKQDANFFDEAEYERRIPKRVFFQFHNDQSLDLQSQTLCVCSLQIP